MADLDFIYKIHNIILHLQNDDPGKYYHKRIVQGCTYCDIAYEYPPLLLVPSDLMVDRQSLEYIINRHHWKMIYNLLQGESPPCGTYCEMADKYPHCVALKFLQKEYLQDKEKYDKQFQAILLLPKLC